MHDPTAIIACVVGIIGCVIGVATFVSAQLTKAKENGVLLAKVDYLVQQFDEQKKDMRERTSAIDRIVDEHTVEITNLQARVDSIERKLDGAS